MHKILLAVDGSTCSDRATAFVVDFVKQHGPIEIHLATIEPEPIEWQTFGLGKQAIDDHLKFRAQSAMKSAQDLIGAAGLVCLAHVRLGDVAQMLVRLADELACDAIVMGTRGLGAVSNLALGSITSKVLHMAHQPVICIK